MRYIALHLLHVTPPFSLQFSVSNKQCWLLNSYLALLSGLTDVKK